MDTISLIGLALAFGAILGGQFLEGGHLSSLFQPTAFIIVIGGTLGAVMLQSPFSVFKQSMSMMKWVISPPHLGQEELIVRIVEWSQIARREGMLALEGHLAEMTDPFLRKGLQLLVDGAEPDRMREVLEVEMYAHEEQMKLSAKVWESAGGYAPTVGILGAVMGLIHVMENLSDPSKLGSGIAVAFVATIYGVGSANLIFLPVAKKLLVHVAHQTVSREMYIDGLIGIANGDNPKIIESRLQGYLV